jgi:hypothetical protein
VYRVLSTVYVYCLPCTSTVYRLPSTLYRLPSTLHRLPSTLYRLPSKVTAKAVATYPCYLSLILLTIICRSICKLLRSTVPHCPHTPVLYHALLATRAYCRRASWIDALHRLRLGLAGQPSRKLVRAKYSRALAFCWPGCQEGRFAKSRCVACWS